MHDPWSRRIFELYASRHREAVQMLAKYGHVIQTPSGPIRSPWLNIANHSMRVMLREFSRAP